MSSTTPRNDQLKTEMVVLADCLDCQWTYQYTGEGRYTGTAALVAGRRHAGRHHHLVLVHRSTEYDGRPT